MTITARPALRILVAAMSVLMLAGVGILLGTPPVSATGGGPVNVPDAPDAPKGTAVFIGGVDLEWNEVPGAESYDVQLFRNGQWVDLPGDGVEIAFYGAGAIISQLNHEGSSYFFRVRANNARGASDWSDYYNMNPTYNHGSGRGARPSNVSVTGTPTIGGTAQVGEVLTASTSGIEDDNGLNRVKFRYQWIRVEGTADTEIEGANGAAYVPEISDNGKTIKVRVSFTDRDGYEESPPTSEATDPVAPPVNTPATGTPVISGTAWVGETLTASVADIQDRNGLEGVAFNYQWIRVEGTTDTEIESANGVTYALQASDEDWTFKVRVDFEDRHGFQESVTSVETEEVGPPDYHGDTLESASDLPLDTLVDGVVNGADDVDFFRIELSDSASISTRTYGLDHRRSVRFKRTTLDSAGNEVTSGDLLETGGVLSAGTYYLKLERYSAYAKSGTERYKIIVKVVPDQGETIETASPLELSDPTTAWSLDNEHRKYGYFHSADDVDFFKVEWPTDGEALVRVSGSIVTHKLHKNLFTISSGLAPRRQARPFAGWYRAFFRSSSRVGGTFPARRKDRSTTHRFGSTTKVCISLRFTTSTDAPSRLCTPAAKGSPV